MAPPLDITPEAQSALEGALARWDVRPSRGAETRRMLVGYDGPSINEAVAPRERPDPAGSLPVEAQHALQGALARWEVRPSDMVPTSGQVPQMRGVIEQKAPEERPDPIGLPQPEFSEQSRPAGSRRPARRMGAPGQQARMAAPGGELSRGSRREESPKHRGRPYETPDAPYRKVRTVERALESGQAVDMDEDSGAQSRWGALAKLGSGGGSTSSSRTRMDTQSDCSGHVLGSGQGDGAADEGSEQLMDTEGSSGSATEQNLRKLEEGEVELEADSRRVEKWAESVLAPAADPGRSPRMGGRLQNFPPPDAPPQGYVQNIPPPGVPPPEKMDTPTSSNIPPRGRLQNHPLGAPVDPPQPLGGSEVIRNKQPGVAQGGPSHRERVYEKYVLPGPRHAIPVGEDEKNSPPQVHWPGVYTSRWPAVQPGCQVGIVPPPEQKQEPAPDKGMERLEPSGPPKERSG